MSGTAPLSAAAGDRGGEGAGRGLLAVALLGFATVLLMVTVVPYVRVADGIPDLTAALVVSVGLLRGQLVGGVTGFAAGLALELASPVGSLGAFALLYLVVGYYAGRYTERPEATQIGAPLLMAVAAAGVVQVGYAVMHALLGTSLSAATLVGRVLVPQMALTALLAPPVLLVCRRVLGEPRVIEPYGGPR